MNAAGAGCAAPVAVSWATKIQFPVSGDMETPNKIIWLPAPKSMTVSAPDWMARMVVPSFVRANS